MHMSICVCVCMCRYTDISIYRMNPDSHYFYAVAPAVWPLEVHSTAATK